MKFFIPFLAAAILFAQSTFASLNYSYTGLGFADGSGQITITYPTDYAGGTHSESGIGIGQLHMLNPLDASTFNAFCLSPSGILTPGPAAYNVLTLEQAKNGLNPPSWSLSGGIENAAYIWAQNQGALTTNAQGAALNLAMWAAVYNSTAVGVTTESGRFSISGAGVSADIQQAYSADIAQLNGATQSAILANYNANTAYILRPVNPSMQDLIVISSVPPPPPVLAPEPSTIFGLLFLGLFVAGQMVTERIKAPVPARAR